MQKALHALASQRGQAYVEVILVLPLILLFLAGVLFFGRALYAKVALEDAATSGVRSAVETLAQSRGLWQGQVAAREMLRAYGLERTEISVRPLAPWSYGTPIVVRVRHRLYVGDIPLLSWFYGGRWVELESRAFLRVEEYKSRWTR